MSRTRRRRDLVLALALALAAIVVATSVVTSYRKIQTFQPLGFEARAAAGHWEILQVEAGLTELVPGDQLLLVDGDGPGRIPDLRSALTRRGTSELVVLRDGEVVTIPYRPPALRIDLSYLILALTACVYLFIGFYTLLRDQRRPALLFFVWCVISAAVYLITVTPPFDWVDRSGYLLEEIARILLGPLTLHLFTVFPRPLVATPGLSRAIPFYYLPAAVLMTMQVDLLAFNGSLFFGGAVATALSVLDRLELVHLTVFALAAVAVLTWRLAKTREVEAQRQAAWLAVGTLFGYLPFFALYVAPRALGMEWPQLPTALTVLPLALVPLTFSYAILRFRLWDIGVIVRDALSLSLTVLLGVGGFALANLVVSRLVPSELALGRNILVFASGLVIAGLMVPTRRSFGRSLARLQYGEGWTRRRALLDFGREILDERSLDTLLDRLSAALRDGLEVGSVNLLLPAPGGFAVRRPHSNLPQIISGEPFDEKFWDHDVTPLSAIGLADRDLSRQQLFTAGYRYAFPLQVRRQPLGIFLAGYRIDQIPLSSDDLELMRTLLDQAALAIENARLLDRVAQQLAEMSRLQQFSQCIIDSSPAGIAVLDENDRIVSANRAFATIAESSTEQLGGMLLSQVLPTLTIPQPEDGLQEVVIDGKDGHRHLQISSARLVGESAGTGQVLMIQDISKRVAMEQALVEKDRMAALGVLAAGVAHEVNTPITGISSYAQMLLADTEPDSPQHRLLKKVEKQTFRAARIVNNLLNLARNQGGGRQRLDVVPLLDECLDLLRERMLDRRIVLAWQPPDRAIETVANDGELQQVFTNLLLNAIDAMSSDGGRLGVAVEARQRWVEIVIEDTGSGIAADAIEDIFQPFYSTKLTQGGTGLGLSIAHDIIDRHEGTIAVTSEEGVGSCFMVRLPRYREHQDGG